MSIVTVNSTGSLLQTLNAAQAGDTIYVAPGSYSGVSISNFKSAGQVTIVSADPNNPATFLDLNVQASKGLNFIGLEFSASANSDFPFKVNASEDIHFDKISMHGSLNGNPTDDTNGLKIGSSRNVSVTGSEFQQLKNGLDIGGNTGVRVESNSFHDIRIDGIHATGASQVVINGNYFTNFKHISGDHSDAIQFFTKNRTESASDITITNNVISQGTGDVMQGIFMGDEEKNLPYVNVKISGNVILGGNWNSIFISSGRNVEITDNHLAAYSGSNYQSRLVVAGVDGATITGNTATKYSLDSSNTHVIQSANVLSQSVANAGIDTIKAWLEKNPVFLIKLPESLLDILEGQPHAVGALGASAGAAIAPPVAQVVQPVAVVEHIDVIGTPAADHLTGGAGDSTMLGGVGNDTLVAVSGTNYLRGDDGNDSITGGSGFDDINGNIGNDTASGGLGNDWVVGGKDNDLLSGETGDDIVYGNLGSDTVDGGVGNDVVRGGQDNDWLDGGAGDDWLSGDRGDDTIAGGAGADVFHTFADAGVDRVLDFHRSEGDRVMVDAGTHYSVAQTGADVTISMVGGGQMVLVGVNLSTLSGDWIFGA